MAHSLDTYLRTYRKKLYLSQRDVAVLLGHPGARTNVSRHETGVRTPSFETAIRYEVILGKAIRDLFPGHFRKAELAVAKRALALLEKDGPSGAIGRAREERLTALANAVRPSPNPPWSQ